MDERHNAADSKMTELAEEQRLIINPNIQRKAIMNQEKMDGISTTKNPSKSHVK